MKVFRFLQVFIVLLLSCNAIAGYSDDYSSSIPEEQSWTLGHNDPVELAREVITSSSSFWTPLGYGTMRLKYSIGRFAAQNGAGHLLLQSPRLTLDLIQGGLYGVVSSVSKDILLDIIEKSVGSPQELCEDVSNSVINEGLDDYAIAYEIARKFIDDGSISREEAIEFLDKRWGVYKLVYAEGLYNASSSENYSLGSQARDILIEDITGELMNEYQRALGSGIPLPVAEYAFFVNDLVDILDNRNVGLMEYPPYLDFVSNMEGLNALRLDEMERFNSSDALHNYTITQNGIAGITVDTRPEDLLTLFGEDNLESTIIYLDEGWGLEGTIVNRGTNNELTVLWEEDSIQQIIIGGSGSRTPEGIGLGSKLTDVENVIGEFEVSGFGWQFAGLARFSGTIYANLFAMFSPEIAVQGNGGYPGDRFYPSSDMRQFNMTVSDLAIEF